jgi:hypothetical protein
MKEFRYLLLGLAMAMLTTSCEKGWLDVTASNEIKAENQFKQTSGFRDALMGVYIGMTKPELYSRDMTWNLVDLLSQQYNPLPSLAHYDKVQQFDYKAVEAVDKVDAIWNSQYNVIANVNATLGFVNKSDGVLNKIDYSIIKGELLGLRALLHFDLIRLYGHSNYAGRPDLKTRLTIPYVTSFSKELTPQLSYDETFKLLEKDIQDALDLLTEDPIYADPQRPQNYYAEVNRGGFYNDRQLRMNYYAVKALQARVLSWQGGDKMATAAAAAEDVIAGSKAKLITPATNIDEDLSLSPEHIFGLQVSGFANITLVYFGTNNNTNYDALFIPASVAQTMYEAHVPTIGLSDIRYTKLLSSSSRGMIPVKLRQGDFPTQTGVMPLMKVPEMYYIAAEYYIKSNPAKAVDYLNTVRASRSITQQIVPASTTLLEDELFKEYRKEYVSEGQLFFYYKKIGRESIPNLAGVVAGDKVYMLPYPDSEVEFGNRIQ